ncbi:hypothetical protein DIPPA_08164 [Diplonema papillatum]|nr:hypothetical protein DIPPA_35556 [Diplonema papillatum]KAJ9447114.1 hypothetical protein DIPPA_08164 [Diplonema papillatum]
MALTRFFLGVGSGGHDGRTKNQPDDDRPLYNVGGLDVQRTNLMMTDRCTMSLAYGLEATSEEHSSYETLTELKAQVYKSNDCSGIPITSSDSSGSSSDSSGSDATASDPDEAKDVERHTETCVGCCYEGESASGAVYKKAYMSCHEGKVVTSEATYTNDPACSSGNQTDTSVSVFNGRCLEMDSPVLGIQSMKLHVGDAVTAAICKTVDLASKHPDFGRANIVGYDEMVAQLPFTAQAVKAQGGGESASLPAVSVLLGVLALAATLL